VIGRDSLVVVLVALAGMGSTILPYERRVPFMGVEDGQTVWRSSSDEERVAGGRKATVQVNV
ncbi:MAG: hypothetical protein ACR2LS_09405, partial [Thermomicrobiales bacterium]